MNEQFVTLTRPVYESRERIARRRKSLQERVANLATAIDSGGCVFSIDELKTLSVTCGLLSLHPEAQRILRWLGCRG